MLASPVLMAASVNCSPTTVKGVLPHVIITEYFWVEINPTSYDVICQNIWLYNKNINYHQIHNSIIHMVLLKHVWMLVLEYQEDQHSCRVGECVTKTWHNGVCNEFILMSWKLWLVENYRSIYQILKTFSQFT